MVSRFDYAPNHMSSSRHSPHRSGLWDLAAWIVVTLTFLVALYANRFGVDVDPDSGDYLTAGMRLAHGEGVSDPNRTGQPKPMTWFPPGMAVVVAINEKAGLPPFKTFGVLNALCWGTLAGVAAVMTRGCTQGTAWPAIAAAFVLTTRSTYYVHSLLLSEPLFLLAVMGALWQLAKGVDPATKPRYRHVVLGGFLTCVAIFIRYAGVAIVPATALVLVMTPGRLWRFKAVSFLLFAAIALGPIFAWTQYHRPTGGAATGRTLAWHPITPDQVDNGLETFTSFFLPEHPAHTLLPHQPPAWLVPLGAMGLMTLLLWYSRGLTTRATLPSVDDALPRVCLTFACTYVAFLIVSISLFDAATGLDDRILSVLVVPVAVCGAWLLDRFSDRRPAWKWVVLSTISLMLLAKGWDVARAIGWRESPEDLATWAFHDSDTLNAVRKLPSGDRVSSDRPCGIYIGCRTLTDTLPSRPLTYAADFVPPPSDTSADATDYREAIADLREQLGDSGGGSIVLWHRLPGWGDGFLTEADIRANFLIDEETNLDDGLILHVGEPEKQPAHAPPHATPPTITPTRPH
jgi:hypothetical protein